MRCKMTLISPVKADASYNDNLLMEKTSSVINCHRVGRIVAFHKEDLTCDVELLETGTTALGGNLDYAPLLQLPLIIEGTDSSHLTWGNIVGSECLVHFNDRDIDNWFVTGEKYTPNSTRLHNLSDGFVTLRPFSNGKVFSYYENGVEVKNGNCVVRLNDDSTIEMTNGTCVFKMSGDTISITGKLNVTDTATAQDCISDGISGKSHLHGGVQSGGSTTGAPQ